MRRRTVLLLGAGASSLAVGMSLGQGESSPITLLNAPLEVQGEWGKSAPGAATAVIARMREVCLAGVKLLSDQQPTGLRVENHGSGSANDRMLPPAAMASPMPAFALHLVPLLLLVRIQKRTNLAVRGFADVHHFRPAIVLRGRGVRTKLLHLRLL